jgi:hypothetical protein
MSSGQLAAADLGAKARDTAQDTFKNEGRSYDSTSTSSVQ